MQTVDRAEFISWGQGVLLDFENGKGIIVNEENCENAEKALMNGEKVALTSNGKIVSYISIKDNCIFEEEGE